MALALIGCGSSEEAAPAGPTPVPQVVTFNTVDGGQFDLGDLNGQDSVLWFWAPW